MTKKMTEKDREHYKSRILMNLTKHAGRAKAIGMGELFEEVFEEPWEHRINDTRRLRHLVTELREDGIPICSTVGRGGSGYWIAIGTELNDYCEKLTSRALEILKQVTKFKEETVPALHGQTQLKLKED